MAPPDEEKISIDVPPLPSVSQQLNGHYGADGKTETTSSSVFLHIPVGRLVAISIISWGLYESYWIYKNWRYIKERDNLDIRPLWRGVFGIFYCYGILKSIQGDRETNAIERAAFSAGGLATGWIILLLLSSAFGRADDVGVAKLGVIISFLSFLFFVPVQNYINRVNTRNNPNSSYNTWSAGHIVCIVIGALYWLVFLAAQ
jgi:hypothetical protein